MPPETFRALRLVDGQGDGECEREGKKSNVMGNRGMGRKIKSDRGDGLKGEEGFREGCEGKEEGSRTEEKQQKKHQQVCSCELARHLLPKLHNRKSGVDPEGKAGGLVCAADVQAGVWSQRDTEARR